MKTAPERIWLGKPPDDKSWEWHGAWSPQPFSENVNSFAYVRQDIADEWVRALRDALELAAKRLDFLTNWIQNSHGGGSQDVQLGRAYAEAARNALKEAE